MSVFFIDTNSEIPHNIAKELNITNIIRMPYTICDNEYFYDLGEKTNFKEFFDLVKAGNMPITSGLNSEMYKKYFEPYFEKGEDILYVSFGTEFSGTFKYLDTAIAELSEKYPSAKFTRYDTKAISVAVGLQVYAAAKMFNSGMSNQEIVEKMPAITERINTIATPTDLFYLKRGGRLSGIQAALGSLMQVKPILKCTKSGKLVNSGKVNGRKKALNTIVTDVLTRIDRTALSDFPISVINADVQDDADYVISKIKQELPEAIIWDNQVGPVIGTHGGPGVLSVFYYGEIRELD